MHASLIVIVLCMLLNILIPYRQWCKSKKFCCRWYRDNLPFMMSSGRDQRLARQDFLSDVNAEELWEYTRRNFIWQLKEVHV